MEIARDLIRTAAHFCKADAVKFQKRCNKELLTPEQYNAPHPNPKNSYGDTYGAHREFLEFTADQHRQLKEWCDEAGIEYSTSVWDLTSAKEIAPLNPRFIKIPSACNNHFTMLQWLCDNYGGEIQLSLGMTTHAEEEQIVDLFVKNGRNKDLVLYDCTSGYPVPYEDICLMELKRLKEKFGDTVKQIGFSGHHIGGPYVKFHRILFESFRIERVEYLRHRMVTEFSAIQIAGLYKRPETAVAPVPAVPFVVSDGSSDLMGFVVAPKGRTGRDAGRPVKDYPVFHEDIDHTACEHAPHRTAFKYKSLFICTHVLICRGTFPPRIPFCKDSV
jgi:hypothetical protein